MGHDTRADVWLGYSASIGMLLSSEEVGQSFFIIGNSLCDIVCALSFNIAYSFFVAKSESQPDSGVGML